MNTAGLIILIVFLALLAVAVWWLLFARVRAHRLGLPPPTVSAFIPFYSPRSSYGVQPASGGIGGWISDRMRRLKSRNSRSAAGAYEGPAPVSGNRNRAGFGPLDPDDAWDARVGTEAEAYYYNEEQELGLHGHGNGSRLNVGNTAYLGSGSFGGSTYDMNVAKTTPTTTTTAGGAGGTIGPDGFEEQRGRSRGRSPAAPAPAPAPANNPFDDNADPSNMSMRGVSPRPIPDAVVTTTGGKDDQKDDSPTERRSMFRENV